MSEQQQDDQTLRYLAVSLTRSGNTDDARQAAAQIADKKTQRGAWMGILYVQFFELKDLAGVKNTLASLSDDSLWDGPWVRKLLEALAKAGDSVGALQIVSKLKDPTYRGRQYIRLARTLALHNDHKGTEQTLSWLSKDPDRMLSAETRIMLDSALGSIACDLVREGKDSEQARQYAARISDANEREWILSLLESIEEEKRHPPMFFGAR